jgi:hypothetical protein
LNTFFIGGPSRDDEEFLEAVTGAMRSVVQSLKDALLQVSVFYRY